MPTEIWENHTEKDQSGRKKMGKITYTFVVAAAVVREGFIKKVGKEGPPAPQRLVI